MLNVGPGGIFVLIASMLFYFIVAIKWQRLNVIMSALITASIPFGYTFFLGVIDATMLHVSLGDIITSELLFTAVLQFLVALPLFRGVRTTQDGIKRAWYVWIGGGFIVLFFVVPQVITVMITTLQ